MDRRDTAFSIDKIEEAAIMETKNNRGTAMKTLTLAEMKDYLPHLMKDALKGHKMYRISSQEGSAILMSEEDFESLQETVELLSLPHFKESVEEAKEDIKAGRLYSIEEVLGGI
jgi:antitoxin YefM